MQEYTMDILRGWPKLGARMWGLCLQFFVVEEIVRIGWAVNNKHYSMTGNWISDLGARGAPWHWMMNGSFLLQGVLIAGGALLVRPLFPSRFVYWLVLLLLVASGLGLLAVGLFPENANIQVHGMAALVHLLCGNVAMIVLGAVTFLRLRGKVTLAAGVIGVAALLMVGFINGHPRTPLAMNAGLIERLAAYPLPLWLAWTGFRMLNFSFND